MIGLFCGNHWDPGCRPGLGSVWTLINLLISLFLSLLLNVCLRNPWDAMKPLLSTYLLKYSLNFINASWPLNCFKVSGNHCSRIQTAPQGICWWAGVCQTFSPQKTRKDENIPARWASGSATLCPREPLRVGGFSAPVAFGLRPAVNLSQEVPMFLPFLRRASSPSWRHTQAEQNTICCLSEDPETGWGGVGSGRSASSPFMGPVCKMWQLQFLYW